MHTHTCTHTHAHTHTHTHARTRTHTCKQEQWNSHAHIHTRMHTYTHACTHTHTHACTHTYTHTHAHAHTHTYARKWEQWNLADSPWFLVLYLVSQGSSWFRLVMFVQWPLFHFLLKMNHFNSKQHSLLACCWVEPLFEDCPNNQQKWAGLG